MTRFCSECGEKLEDAAQFCPSCGKRLESEERFCPNCGEKLESGDQFCSKCGMGGSGQIDEGEPTYEDLIRDIVYIEENGEARLSKAKLIGAGFFIVIVVSAMVLLVPDALRYGFSQFFIVMFGCFLSGLIYYGICRLVGRLVRSRTVR